VVAVSLSGQPAPANGNGNGHNGNGHNGNGNHDLESLPIPGPVRRLRLGQAFLAFTRAINASGRIQGELRLSMEKPDVIIRPDVGHVGVLDTPDVNDLATRGEQAAEEVLPQLRRILRQRTPFGAVANLFTRS
jgi:hypothetical protein